MCLRTSDSLGILLKTSFREGIFTAILSISKTRSWWNLILRKTVEKEERSLTTSTEFLLRRLMSVYWVDEKTFIQRSDAGEVTHFQGIIEDVTKKIKKPESLKIKSERWVAKLLRNSKFETDETSWE